MKSNFVDSSKNQHTIFWIIALPISKINPFWGQEWCRSCFWVLHWDLRCLPQLSQFLTENLSRNFAFISPAKVWATARETSANSVTQSPGQGHFRVTYQTNIENNEALLKTVISRKYQSYLWSVLATYVQVVTGQTTTLQPK